MADEPQQLHVVFFPFMAYGHMIPMFDMARLFSAQGVKATIITTPLNAHTFIRGVRKSKKDGSQSIDIDIEVFNFASIESGLPEGCENLEQAVGFGIVEKFCKSAEMLREQLEQFLGKNRPNCLVADMFFPWASDSAAKFNIPRLVFHGISFFAICAIDIIMKYQPYRNVSSNEEPFVISSFPHEIYMTRLQIPEDLMKDEQTEYKLRWEMIKESEVKSYGVIVNSFYELEPDYANFFKEKLGKRAWHIGPVSLCNSSIEDKAQRGKQASIDEHECLRWLNSKRPNSVIYVSFGSTCHLVVPQLHEIACALESYGHDFIWVIRKDDESGKSEEWLPREFAQRVAGKGLLIQGWAPQVLILEHEAIGAFVTHCGWNSILEGVSAGLPLVTWPIFADQFYNEKLVNHVLKIGVPVGATKWSTVPSLEGVVKQDAIVKALREIMVGEEAEERRNRAIKLKEKAWKAVEDGGSSSSELSALLNELTGSHA